MHLAGVKLPLSNVSFFVADDELVCEDVLIGLPALQSLPVYIPTLLERNRVALEGANCSELNNISTDERAGNISRVMLCSLNRSTEKHPAEYHDQKELTPTVRPLRCITYRT